VGDRPAHHSAEVSDKFDYEGEIVLVIGKEGRHVPQEGALSMIGGFNARQRRQRARLAAARQLECHPKAEFRQVRQCRPVDGHDDESTRQIRCA